MLFATMWMNLDGFMLSEISQTEKDKCLYSYIHNQKNRTYRYREQIGGCQRGRSGGAGVWGKWVKKVKDINFQLQDKYALGTSCTPWGL